MSLNLSDIQFGLFPIQNLLLVSCRTYILVLETYHYILIIYQNILFPLISETQRVLKF